MEGKVSKPKRHRWRPPIKLEPDVWYSICVSSWTDNVAAAWSRAGLFNSTRSLAAFWTSGHLLGRAAVGKAASDYSGK